MGFVDLCLCENLKTNLPNTFSLHNFVLDIMIKYSYFSHCFLFYYDLRYLCKYACLSFENLVF